jgi:hypothetical protein
MPASVKARSFDSANFPESFTRGVNAALKRQEMAMVWRSDTAVLMRVNGPGS